METLNQTLLLPREVIGWFNGNENFKTLWIDTLLIVQLIAVCHHFPKYFLEFVCYKGYLAALLEAR